MTEEELAAIERVWAAAKPGPWTVDTEGDVYLEPHGPPICQALGMESYSLDAADARAIAAAPTHVAALTAEVRRLQGLLAEKV